MFLQDAPSQSVEQMVLSWIINNFTLVGLAIIVWYRFGRNAEKVFSSLGRVGELGNIVTEMSRTLSGIREILTKHEVRLDNQDEEIGRVENQVHARISRLEDRRERGT